ncbi:hypothetical protein ASZ90_019387 [hydrocarbon metagenome]|uniref:Uncharacterized protein n=1 Tax=hydrocarbon metagenome TaxID=938273 RepID=A0A0W8E3Q7_9ZZZZ
MSKPDPTPYMVEFLRLLASELETNTPLAKRLSLPLMEYLNSNVIKDPGSPTRKSKKPSSIPEGFNPLKIYYEQGEAGLMTSLQDMDINTLKSIISEYGLDPARTYSRWRKHERLSSFIVERVKALNNKGKVFGPR